MRSPPTLPPHPPKKKIWNVHKLDCEQCPGVFSFASRIYQWIFPTRNSAVAIQETKRQWRRGKRRVISGELFQSELFWRVIFMQSRLFIVINLDSLQSQLSSNT